MIFSTKYRSPNFNQRPEDVKISAIVIHYTDMVSAEAALNRLCDPAAEVSCHYVIDEDGTLYQLVDEDKRAWHAGKSYWQGKENINNFSIGIELVNPGTDFIAHPFTSLQMSCLRELLLSLLQKYQISPSCIIGHSDIAHERKIDPGEYFDWQYLASEGIGLYPDLNQLPNSNSILLRQGDSGEAVLKLQKDLHLYGYKISFTGHFDEEMTSVVIAFKRHFSQDNLRLEWDSKAAAILEYLLKFV